MVLKPALVVLALLVLTPAAHAQGPEEGDPGDDCTWQWNENGFTMRCGEDQGAGAAGSGSDDGPWWTSATAQAIYAFIGFGIPAAVGGFAYWRHRQRKHRLEAYMHAVDDAFAANRTNPSEGSRALASLRAQMKTDFKENRLTDSNFLELDKRAGAAMHKLRLLEMDQRFPTLPVGLRSQITTLISDGTLSTAEVDLVRTSLASHLIPGRVRDELLVLLDGWARQDAGEAAVLDAPPAPPDSVVVRVQEP